MDFPPSQVSPRIPLGSKVKREAELYVYNSTIRGLHDNGLFDWEKCNKVFGCGKRERLESHVNAILNSDFSGEYKSLYKKKEVGLHGELAFHLYRCCNYKIAFTVALSYILHNHGYTYILPDACLDASASVGSFCSGSKKLEVKTQSYRGNNEEVGLNSKERHHELYVAVSERPKHTPSYDDAGKRIYEVIDYAILGYAFKRQLDNVEPKNGWFFIHFYDLHPIDSLTSSDYQTSETVYDRMKKLGYV